MAAPSKQELPSPHTRTADRDGEAGSVCMEHALLLCRARFKISPPLSPPRGSIDTEQFSRVSPLGSLCRLGLFTLSEDGPGLTHNTFCVSH